MCILTRLIKTESALCFLRKLDAINFSAV
uniref:Uncharacterized protein n=1 Tax=Anguilla anguilla TaxID=7936 RepID=A0A0E9WE85_ANGAN